MKKFLLDTVCYTFAIISFAGIAGAFGAFCAFREIGLVSFNNFLTASFIISICSSLISGTAGIASMKLDKKAEKAKKQKVKENVVIEEYVPEKQQLQSSPARMDIYTRYQQQKSQEKHNNIEK